MELGLLPRRDAVRKSRSTGLTSVGCAPATSSAAPSRDPRNKRSSSRAPAAHSCAPFASVWRTRRPSRSASSQPRRRGHSRSSASCATSAVASFVTTRRWSTRSVSTAACSSSTTSSSSGARRLTSSVPTPGSARRRKIPARDVLLRGRQSRVDVVGEVCDRAVHPTRRLVPLERERRAVPAVPRLEQCGLEQRQRARFGSDVVEDPLDQPVLEHEAGAVEPAPRWPAAARRVASGRPARSPARAAPRRRRVPRSGAVVVGPDRRQHPARGIGGVGRVHQDVEEPVAHRVVAAHGEHLFELVDDDHQRAVAGSAVHRPRREAGERLGVVEQPVADVIRRRGVANGSEHACQLEHRIRTRSDEDAWPLRAARAARRRPAPQGDRPA